MIKKWLAAVWIFSVFLWGSSEAAAPLPVAQAFHLSAQIQDSQHVNLVWQIAPDYHLYSDAFKISVVEPVAARLAEWQLPDGKMAFDPSRGHYVEYTGQLTLPLRLTAGSVEHLRLRVSFQGCADLGFCYPPQTQIINLDKKFVTNHSDLSKISALLSQQSLLGIWLAFFIFGLLLAFTPCVFPMLPILSSIIVGHGTKLSTAKAFSLSLIYVLASAFTYAIAGAIAGLAGNRWQTALQNPWVLGFSGLFLSLLALSLFGFYEVQLPHRWQQKLTGFSRQQTSGRYWGAAVMGVLASLIVSPCVSAPLVGALAFIGQTGSAWLGGSALLMMGLGMGMPLLAIGLSAGKWLPTAGLWMTRVKAIFGVSLLWLAINLWSRFLSDQWSLVLWSLLSLGTAVYLGAFEAAVSGWSRLWKAAGLALALYGASLMVGALSGASNPWQPLAHLNSAAVQAIDPVVTDEKSLNSLLATAKERQQALILDFSAVWCVACHSMQREVFDQSDVQQALHVGGIDVVKVDVTAQNADSLALQQRFGVVAPPTLIFIDKHGQVQAAQTLVGEQSKAQFLQQLSLLVLQ